MSNAAFSSVINDAMHVITNPVGFYRHMAKSGGYAAPIVFVIVMAVIAGLMVAILSLFGANMSAGMAIGFMAILIIPIMALIGSFIGAAILFVIWKLLGSEESFETAYRCVAYSTAIIPITASLGLIPYLGSIIKLAWSTYLIYVASVEVHNLKAGTAMAVFGVLGSLMLLIALSGERAARSLSGQFGSLETLGKQLEKKGEVLPGEAGKALAEALLGGPDDQTENPKTPPESSVGEPDTKIESQLDKEREPLSEEKQKALAESLAGGFDDQLENLGKQLENEGEFSPEEAGKALGEFLKGIEKATQQEQ